MASLVDNNVVALVSLALDATSLRQQAIAQNIANANTPNYRPVAVNFETHMAEAREALERNPQKWLATLGDFRPTMEFADPNVLGGNQVALDLEVAKLSENMLQHHALLRALSRHFSILGFAVSEGKH